MWQIFHQSHVKNPVVEARHKAFLTFQECFHACSDDLLHAHKGNFHRYVVQRYPCILYEMSLCKGWIERGYDNPALCWQFGSDGLGETLREGLGGSIKCKRGYGLESRDRGDIQYSPFI